MKNFFFILFLTFAIFANGQTEQAYLNHKHFIKKLRNSETGLFQEIIKEYDAYLNEHPHDVSILIEKCRFLNNAQYDEYNEQNPNQELMDSCVTQLVNNFPQSPEVLIYQTELLWSDSLDVILDKARGLMQEEGANWTYKQKAFIYAQIAEVNIRQDEFALAKLNLKKAIENDSSYASSLDYCTVLVATGDTLDAEKAILSNLDTAQGLWYLNKRADLLIKLKKYEKSLEIYNLIQDTDSSYIANNEMAEVFEGIGQYHLARTYLVKDTVRYWKKEEASLTLFLFDLKYLSADTALNSYNAFRDLGFTNDPLALYRLKLFFSFPSTSWKFRDIGALALLLLIFVLFILIPSSWILPVYFIGHYWKITPKISLGNNWGLKAFWWVSIAYTVASLCALLSVPQDIYYYFNDSNYAEELSDEQTVTSLITFTITAAIITLLSLFKVNFRVLLSNKVFIIRTVTITLGYFILYKFASGIYLKAGGALFDYDPFETGFFNQLLLSSQPEITALLKLKGLGFSILIVAIMVPIYEEVMFRGVILESCTRYLTFRWANIFQSTLFAMVHQDLFLFPVFFAFGIITGNLRKKTGGLFGGILFHIINNLAVVYLINIRMSNNLFSFIQMW